MLFPGQAFGPGFSFSLRLEGGLGETVAVTPNGVVGFFVVFYDEFCKVPSKTYSKTLIFPANLHLVREWHHILAKIHSSRPLEA